jgi:hypothetical protein
MPHSIFETPVLRFWGEIVIEHAWLSALAPLLVLLRATLLADALVEITGRELVHFLSGLQVGFRANKNQRVSIGEELPGAAGPRTSATRKAQKRKRETVSHIRTRIRKQTGCQPNAKLTREHI